VPIEISRQYADAARNAGDIIRSIEPEGVDHFDIINAGTAIWKRTVEELRAILQ